MKLMNRPLQLKVLKSLSERYPAPVHASDLGFQPDEAQWTFNAMYLHEHELVAATSSQALFGPLHVPMARITHKGLDFLQDDGGLSAILNVLTVRLDAETIRALIEEKVEASDLPAAEKIKLMDWLKIAGTEGLQEATRRLVGAALDHAPDAIRLLQMLPG